MSSFSIVGLAGCWGIQFQNQYVISIGFGDTLYTGCIKKTEQILNRSQRREAAQSMKFFINIDCLGAYDVE